MKLLTLLFGVLYTARKERYMEPRPSLFSALSFRSVYSIQYSTVYRTVLYTVHRTVQYSTVQYSTVYRTVLYSIQYTEQYCIQYTEQYSTVQYTVQYSIQYTEQYCIQYTEQYSTVQYSTVYSTVQYTEQYCTVYSTQNSTVCSTQAVTCVCCSARALFAWKSAHLKSYISNLRQCIAVWPFDISWPIWAKFRVSDRQVPLLEFCGFCEHYRRECWVRNTDGKKSHRRYRRRWGGNIKVDAKDVGWCRQWGG